MGSRDFLKGENMVCFVDGLGVSLMASLTLGFKMEGTAWDEITGLLRGLAETRESTIPVRCAEMLVGNCGGDTGGGDLIGGGDITGAWV